MCGEVYLTAFAAYAQCVEGLSCDDDGYKASDDAREKLQQAVVASELADCAYTEAFHRERALPRRVASRATVRSGDESAGRALQLVGPHRARLRS